MRERRSRIIELNNSRTILSFSKHDFSMTNRFAIENKNTSRGIRFLPNTRQINVDRSNSCIFDGKKWNCIRVTASWRCDWKVFRSQNGRLIRQVWLYPIINYLTIEWNCHIIILQKLLKNISLIRNSTGFN